MKKNKLRNFLKKVHTVAAIGTIVAGYVMGAAPGIAHAAEDDNSTVTPTNINATIQSDYLSRSLTGRYYVGTWQLTNTPGPLGSFGGHDIIPQSIMGAGLSLPDEIQGNLWTCLEAGKVNAVGSEATVYSLASDIGLSQALNEQLGMIYHFGYGLESVGKTYDNNVSLSNYAYMQSAVWGYLEQVAGNNLGHSQIPGTRDFTQLSANEISAVLAQWVPSSLNASIAGVLSHSDWAVRTANAIVAEREKKTMSENLTQTPTQEIKKGEVITSGVSSVLRNTVDPVVTVDKSGVSATVNAAGQFEVTLDDNADLKTLHNVEVTVTAKGLLTNTISTRSGTLPVSPGGEIGIGEGATSSQYSNSTQKLAIWNDPTLYKGNVTFKVKVVGEGQVQIGKQDAESEKMVPNTSYEGTIGDEAVSFTTDATGWAPLSDFYVHGTEYSLVETSVPAGYVINKTPITGTIVGGEITKITQQNKQQTAIITFEKTKEVFNAEETTKQGTPIYDTVPAEALEFTNKNVNDTTAPDKETVMIPAGEYLDTIVTDEEGQGKSNVPFINGEQNIYVFDEENEPENYRQFEAVEFTVPYGTSETEVVTYDLGTLTNELKAAEVFFNKINDSDFSSILNVPGAKIHVEGISKFNKDVNFVFTTTTETNKLKLPAGTYRFTEVEYPDNFTLSPTQPAVMIVEVKDQEDMEINWKNSELKPEMGTKAYVNGGGKEFDPTVENIFYDEIEFSENFEDGKWLVTKLVGEKTGKVYDTFEGEVVIDENGKMLVKTVIPANTVQNENVYFVETAYNDKTKEKVYAEHDGKDDYGQTLFYKNKSGNMTLGSTGTKGSTGSYPNTGEQAKEALSIMGMMIVATAGFFALKNRKKA